VPDLGRVAVGVAQQLTSECIRNLQSVCLSAFDNATAIVCVTRSAKLSVRLMLPLTFALNVPRHPLDLLLQTTWTSELCPKLFRTLPPLSKCLLLAWSLSCRLCDFLNIAVANGDSKVMSFVFLRTSSLLWRFCPVSPLMFLYYAANSPLTPFMNFASADEGSMPHFSGS